MKREGESDVRLGLESAWVVTRAEREGTFQLAKKGKPHPDPTVAHIMYEAAVVLTARYSGRLLVLLAGCLLVAGAAVALAVAGQPTPAAVVGAAGLLIAGPFVYRAARWTIFWARVRRANSSAR